ncbi:ketosteroid isomerase [Actinoplanes sp. OR16]|uniref:nuclear transport factor 2 family protein n=1 Tax=Actinoplanes sp. OR16 TaxID=946334 RepID=UPI000F6E30AF|nr:nuclear transport factor 2 family protein [Actinoplanes sp. OR16]BBH69720.1 ketosteroid isomerase [Actinoplanes sp. OR16]
MELLTELYAAFNRRDVDAVLTAMTPDVVWPKRWEGGTVRGHDAVRDYWTRQWAEIDPAVEPTGFRQEEDGRVAVAVRQRVRNLDGELIDDRMVEHVYRLDGGLVAGMEIRQV